MQTKIYREDFLNNVSCSKRESTQKETLAIELVLALGMFDDLMFVTRYNPYYSFYKGNLNSSIVFGIEFYNKDNFLRKNELGADILDGNESVALDTAIDSLAVKHQNMLDRVQKATKVFLNYSKLSK